jgi:hypothetical protein
VTPCLNARISPAQTVWPEESVLNAVKMGALMHENRVNLTRFAAAPAGNARARTPACACSHPALAQPFDLDVVGRLTVLVQDACER